MKSFLVAAVFGQVFLLALLWPAPIAAQTQPPCEYNHTIQPGESLGSIAENYYGDALFYNRIVEATNAQAATNSVYTTINNPNTVEPGWLVCIPVDDDPLTGPRPVPPGLSVVDLGNITYQTEWVSTGSAKFVNGWFNATREIDEPIIALTDDIAHGPINGQNMAAVILATSPDDNRIYYDLALVANRGRQPTNINTVALGGGVLPALVQIQDNTVVVVVRLPDEGDPPCCPSRLVLQVYALRDGQLTPIAAQLIGILGRDEVATPAPGPVQAPPEPNPLLQNVTSAIQPEQPYDDSALLVPTGHPEHMAFLFDDVARLRVYPLAAYEAQWNEAGDPTIASLANRLRDLLNNRPAFLYPQLPILPPQAGINDLATQLGYLDFGGGTGVRFVGRVTQDASPITGDQLNYYFQGLTNDGQYLVSFIHPISIPRIIPLDATSVPTATRQLAEEDFEGYHLSVSDLLNQARPADFSPDLARLDALVQALAIAPESPQETASAAANVNSVTIENREGQIIAVVQGQHANGCSELGQPSQIVEGNVISVTLPVLPPPANASCAQAITPYTIQLQVDTTGLAPGDYAFTINGVETDFTLP